QVKKHELRLPKKGELLAIIAVGDDLAVTYRDEKYQGHFYWVSNPAQHYHAASYGYYRGAAERMATVLEGGNVFLGNRPFDRETSKCPRSGPISTMTSDSGT